MDCIICESPFEQVRSNHLSCSKVCGDKASYNKRFTAIMERKGEYKKTPRARFNFQKVNAKRRGIEFNMSFDEWWNIWEDSFEQRGKLPDQLAMCRYGDTGPYEVGNVYLDTNSNNASMAATLQHQDRNKSDGRFV